MSDDERPAPELVAIMTNATRLGFSRSRVATALGLSAAEQAQIEQVIPGADPPADGGRSGHGSRRDVRGAHSK